MLLKKEEKVAENTLVNSVVAWPAFRPAFLQFQAYLGCHIPCPSNKHIAEESQHLYL